MDNLPCKQQQSMYWIFGKLNTSWFLVKFVVPHWHSLFDKYSISLFQPYCILSEYNSYIPFSNCNLDMDNFQGIWYPNVKYLKVKVSLSFIHTSPMQVAKHLDAVIPLVKHTLESLDVALHFHLQNSDCCFMQARLYGSKLISNASKTCIFGFGKLC